MRIATATRRSFGAAFALVVVALGADAQPSGDVAAAQSAAELERRVAALETETAATEAIRAVKRLQHAYGHYAEAGLWEDLADLFAEDAVAHLPSGTLTGK